MGLSLSGSAGRFGPGVDRPGCTLLSPKALILQMAHNSFSANKMRRPVPLFCALNIIETNSPQSTMELPIAVIDSVNGKKTSTRDEGSQGSKRKVNAEGQRPKTEDRRPATPERER
jgi:hypothetical protein